LRERIRQHFAALESNRHGNRLLQSDFNAYGRDSFFVKRIEYDSHLTRSGIEGEWVLRLLAYKEEYGYNTKDPYVSYRGIKATDNVIAYEKDVESSEKTAFYRNLILSEKCVVSEYFKTTISQDKDGIPIYKIADNFQDTPAQKGDESMKIISVGEEYLMVADWEKETSETYSVRDLTNMIALHLAEDVIEYRKGNKEFAKQIELETNALNTLAKVTEVLH
jgi:hypothetical protein